MRQQHFFFSIDMKIHYQVEGDGPVLVCLHGGKGNSGDYFFPFLSSLAEHLRMVYLDERGSGQSKPVPEKERVSYEGMAEDLDHLIKHLGVEQVGLLGHSFGSCLALYYAQTRVERVRELYLVAGGVTSPAIARDWWPRFFDAEMDRLGLRADVQEVYDRYKAGEITADESFREVVKRQIPSIFFRWREQRELIHETLARTDFTFLGAENSNFSEKPDLLGKLSTLRCPTLLMAGQEDISFPLEHWGMMARLIPDCEMCVLPRTRHFPFLEEPELFCQRIQEFRCRRGLACSSGSVTSSEPHPF